MRCNPNFCFAIGYENITISIESINIDIYSINFGVLYHFNFRHRALNFNFIAKFLLQLAFNRFSVVQIKHQYE